MKTTDYIKTDAEAQKHGYQTGLDTLVVHAVTNGDWVIKLKFYDFSKRGNSPPGDYDRKVKTQRNWLRFFKKQWNMWFNAIKSAKSYQEMDYKKKN